VSQEGRVKASPAARRIAGEKGIDLSKISTGSGPCGRILSTDIPATAVPSAKPAPAVSKEIVRKKMSGMRKAIAKNLLASKQNIPHFYMQMTFNAEPMYSCYQTEKQKYPCSLNDLVTLACGRTIREFPAFRSKIDGDDIVEYPSANIGIAVGMDDGLVVPVIVGVDSMTLAELAAESKRIVTTARGGKTENMGKGVFTITNLGMFGVESFSAIINPSEASILAVGALREDIIVKDGAIRAGKVMTMTISADHRLIDGLLAAKFMARLKELLENPSSML
jgi:pyruvate dehydrogenase E2 component (dihydrolipoamide acetyltransferase)